jgi:hypothetical protein
MVLKNPKLPKHSSSRHLLPYFMESKIWIEYEKTYINNHASWISKDPERARKMLEAKAHGGKGYSIQDYLYDMYDFLYSPHYSKATRLRLYDEIDEIEKYHKSMGSLDDML